MCFGYVWVCFVLVLETCCLRFWCDGTLTNCLRSGAIFTFSFGGVNTAQLASETISSSVPVGRLWLDIYEKCHRLGTPLIILSTGCFAWLNYRTGQNSSLAAALSCASLVPYTIILLSRPEKILLAAAHSKEQDSSAPGIFEVRQALSQWGAINMSRVIFPLLGGLLGLISSIS